MPQAQFTTWQLQLSAHSSVPSVVQTFAPAEVKVATTIRTGECSIHTPHHYACCRTKGPQMQCGGQPKKEKHSCWGTHLVQHGQCAGQPRHSQRIARTSSTTLMQAITPSSSCSRDHYGTVLSRLPWCEWECLVHYTTAAINFQTRGFACETTQSRALAQPRLRSNSASEQQATRRCARALAGARRREEERADVHGRSQ